jgi:DNA-binding NarL/FixJ family response regulator
MPGETNRPDRISVLVAEANLLGSELISGALRRCGNRFQVHSFSGNLSETFEALRRHLPDVALIGTDLVDGPASGFKLLQELRASKIRTAPIVLVDSVDEGTVLRAFHAGARGIFCRRAPLRILSKCIRRVNEGQVWASTEQIDLLLQFIANLEPRLVRKKGGLKLLSPREQEVAYLVAEGLSNRDISAKLKLREHTIRNYIFHIFEKLGLSSRVELALYALSQPAQAQDQRSSD